MAILQKKVDRRDSPANAVMGLSNSLVDAGNKSGSSGNHDSLELKRTDSTRIRGAEIIDTNQEHKKRCFEKLVVRTERTTKENVEDVKCSLQVEVIDDTALIEVAAAISGCKNSYAKENNVGVGSNPGNVGGLKNPKQENDGKKRRSKGSKKQGKGCSMKCVKEKKLSNQVVEDQIAKQKKIPDRKGQNGFTKSHPKVKLVYRKKNPNGPHPAAINVQEHPKLETEISPEKIIIGGAFQEPESNSKPSNDYEQESAIELVETEPVIEKEDGLMINPKMNDEGEDDGNVSEIAKVESKKMAYTRSEMEALRFVKEDEQKKKWKSVYDGFSPSVVKEYMSLVSDMNRYQITQRYNRVMNCGSSSTSNRHAILSMPPVLPFCSSSSYKKISPIGQMGFRVNFP